MKKFALSVIAMALLCSCNGLKIESLSITPETATVFVDENLPELSLSATPQDALEGVSVTWTSSNPEIISVAGDGKIEFAVNDIEGEENVTITAKAGDKTAVCIITVKGQICKYGINDLSQELGLLFLDRNIGAANVGDAGNYYQKGNNTPVAYTGSTEVNASYNKEWSEKSEGFVDWSKPENTPCPKGWRIPNGDDMNLLKKNVLDPIADYEMFDMGDYPEAEYAILKKINPAVSGRFQPEKKIDAAKCFWSTFVNETNGRLGVYEDNNFPNFSKSYMYSVAIPVRCVKDAENK